MVGTTIVRCIVSRCCCKSSPPNNRLTTDSNTYTRHTSHTHTSCRRTVPARTKKKQLPPENEDFHLVRIPSQRLFVLQLEARPHTESHTSYLYIYMILHYCCVLFMFRFFHLIRKKALTETHRIVRSPSFRRNGKCFFMGNAPDGGGGKHIYIFCTAREHHRTHDTSDDIIKGSYCTRLHFI